jgi:anti-anti-sigma regulatory factor
MKLASKLHISEVEGLTKELTSLLDSSQDVSIDVSDVEAIDTASMQALCSLQKSLAVTGSNINWVGHSKAFKEAADTLGVAEFLAITE